MSKKEEENMEINKKFQSEQPPTIEEPYLFYELIVPGNPEKAIGSMRIDNKSIELIKAQIRQRKDKIVFNMFGTDWPMSINTDKYSRVWFEMIETEVVVGDEGSLIIDPNTGQAAKKEKKLILQ